MKAVILLAGKGRRLQKEINIIHKSLTLLDNNTLIYNLIGNVKKAGIEEVIPLVGYNGDNVLEEIYKFKDELTINPIWNKNYENTNNLYTLWKAKEELKGQEFILINGDLVFDYRILVEILKSNKAQIAIDDKEYSKPIDSPGVIIKGGVIKSLGRHILFENTDGYAIGIYKFTAELSEIFFDVAEEMLSENLNFGFHDPLEKIFDVYNIYSCSTRQYLWTDIDEKCDIPKARKYLSNIKLGVLD